MTGCCFRLSFILLILNTYTNITSANSSLNNVKLFLLENLHSVQTSDFQDHFINIEIYDASLLRRIEIYLSKNLSSNPKFASQQVLQRIETNYQLLKDLLRRASNTQVLIQKFGIEEFPAAVLDDTIVIYGTTNPRIILEKWYAVQ